MAQQRPLQPQYKVLIKGPSGAFADVTEFVDFGVEYEENADMTRTLSFVIGKWGEVYINRIALYQEVEFWGGSQTQFDKIFTGMIHRIGTVLPKGGDIKVRVECLTLTWRKLAKNLMNNDVYPSLKSTRAFASAQPSMKISQIVAGICQENDVQVGDIDIPSTADQTFTLTNAFKQHFQSDWSLLRRLAYLTGCTVWTEFANGQELLYFRDRSKVRNQPSESQISFRYMVLRDEAPQMYDAVALDQNQQLIWDVNVDEEIADATAVSYAGSRFDFNTGQEVNLLSEAIVDKDGKTQLTFYELDEQKVAALEQTNPDRAAELRRMGTFDYIPWDIAKQFYRPVQVVDEQAAIYDQAFFGVTITCMTNGNIAIRSQRAYPVYGVLRYATPNKKSGLYWLYGLKHIWNEDGFLTELTFRK